MSVSYVVRNEASEFAWADIRNFIHFKKDRGESIYSKEFSVISETIFKDINRVENFLIEYNSNPVRIDYSTYYSIIYCDDFLVYIWLDDYAKKTYVSVYACDEGDAELVLKKIKTLLTQDIPVVEWCYKTSHGTSSTYIPIKTEYETKDEYYPYIKEGLSSFFERYNKSSASVLVCLGEPGTGKTSFIRHYIKSYNRKAIVTYDESILNSDRFLIDFITDPQKDTLVIEDADILLAARNKELNKTMNKFLNLSDGLIKLPNKKIIFSTNLKDPRDIDSALIRPGRCFDVLQFRHLTLSEARVINENINISGDISLANVFNGDNNVKQTKIGFI